MNIPKNPHPSDTDDGKKQDSYLTSREAASYLRKSVSWLVKRNDIPYLRGVPNTYKKADLDSWFERNKFNPRVA